MNKRAGISIHFVISQATGNQGSITSNDSYNNECFRAGKAPRLFLFFSDKEILSKSNSLSHSFKLNLCTISIKSIKKMWQNEHFDVIITTLILKGSVYFHLVVNFFHYKL